jgi:branched-chain amino acid transport system permease protein
VELLLLNVATLVVLYATLAAALDLVVGHGGLLSLAHAALFGAGAYAAAIMATAGYGLAPTLVAAALAGTVLACVVAAMAARLQEDTFAIVTFALQILFTSVLLNAVGVTNGALGITGIRRPSLIGISFNDPYAFLALCVLTGGGAIALLWQIERNPYGRALRVTREDAVFARALGLRPVRLRTGAVLISGGLSGVVGALYAYYIGLVTPSQFGVMDSVLILSMVLIGGASRPWGPIAGATLLMVLPEVLRFVGIPSVVAGDVRMLLYGAGLVAIVFARPSGLSTHTRTLKGD